MDNIRAIRAFVEVGRAGSFVAGAKRLGCSTTTASRLVRELEEALGEPLLLRTTRSVRLSSQGLRRLPDCENIIHAMDALCQPSPEQREDLAGELRVATSTSFAQRRVMPILPEFLQQHPRLKMFWQLNDQRMGLSTQGVDMAIRIAPLDNSGMVARRLGRIGIWLVVSPQQIEREGMPKDLQDVANMSCTVCTVPRFRNRWPLNPQTLVDGPLWTDCGDVSREAAIAGLGVAFLPDFMVENEVADGRLVRLFPERDIGSVEIAVLYPGRNQVSVAAAAFGEFLVRRLGS